MTRTKRSPSDLQADLRTLLYEFEMLCGAASCWSKLSSQKERIASNAVIESFAIHCRALINFFFDHNTTNNTDVIATDFFENPTEWSSKYQSNTLWDEAKKQANKEIAHIVLVQPDIEF